MVLMFLHEILLLTVLSSTTTVDQMELDGALTRYLAHDCDVPMTPLQVRIDDEGNLQPR